MGGTHPETLAKRLEAISKLHFFRDGHGNEVDLRIQRGAQPVPVEIKAAKTWSAYFLKDIKCLNKAASEYAQPGFVVYNGDQQAPSKAPG